MRTALQLFDFDDPSIADLKRLLLQAAFAPSFLRCAEGRRTIAYMFNLQPAFVAELTAIVKNQIPGGRKSGESRGWEGRDQIPALCRGMIEQARSRGTGLHWLALDDTLTPSMASHWQAAAQPALPAPLFCCSAGRVWGDHLPGLEHLHRRLPAQRAAELHPGRARGLALLHWA